MPWLVTMPVHRARVVVVDDGWKEEGIVLLFGFASVLGPQWHCKLAFQITMGPMPVLQRLQLNNMWLGLSFS